jgi:hypothetical protein
MIILPFTPKFLSIVAFSLLTSVTTNIGMAVEPVTLNTDRSFPKIDTLADCFRQK